ncbi:hypothetical protein MBEBAB_1017 [Brevundimonas abyssalis TAR-001]|uniref:Uncharacterized protein n=1 Tax=Brevundimonas abyssalis TAR-001 TaxID=1391729 RepID=A0A8E0NB97_9CAUL|nr:hypothetical protein MBEBAB_1017 [Brevundimonas abyssalis TAR-001]
MVDSEDQITASTYAVGNRASASGDDGVGFQVQSDQTMTGNGRSTIELNLSGEAEGPVTLTSQVEATGWRPRPTAPISMFRPPRPWAPPT